jgi:replication factor C subunit 3/5
VTENTPIPPPDWESLISQIADEIYEEHTPARILQVRAKLYDLLTHCIPASTILKASFFACRQRTITDDLKTLTFELVKKVDPAMKADVIMWSAFYEHRIRLGSVSVSAVLF